jgi:hypothetical protein
MELKISGVGLSLNTNNGEVISAATVYSGPTGRDFLARSAGPGIVMAFRNQRARTHYIDLLLFGTHKMN